MGLHEEKLVVPKLCGTAQGELYANADSPVYCHEERNYIQKEVSKKVNDIPRRM